MFMTPVKVVFRTAYTVNGGGGAFLLPQKEKRDKKLLKVDER